MLKLRHPNFYAVIDPRSALPKLHMAQDSNRVTSCCKGLSVDMCSYYSTISACEVFSFDMWQIVTLDSMIEWELHI